MCANADSQSRILGLEPKCSPLHSVLNAAVSEDEVFEGNVLSADDLLPLRTGNR